MNARVQQSEINTYVWKIVEEEKRTARPEHMGERGQEKESLSKN